MRTNIRRTGTITTLVALASLGVAACGAGSAASNTTTPGVASLGTAAPTENSTADPNAPKTFEEAQVAFNKCVSSKGIDMSQFANDADEGGPNAVLDDSVAAGDAPVMDEAQLAKMDEAFEECGKVFEGLQDEVSFNPEQEALMKDMELAWKQCMTEQGIDPSFFTPPSEDSAGAPGPAFTEENQAKFEAANKVCDPKVMEDLKKKDPELAKQLESEMGG